MKMYIVRALSADESEELHAVVRANSKREAIRKVKESFGQTFEFGHDDFVNNRITATLGEWRDDVVRATITQRK